MTDPRTYLNRIEDYKTKPRTFLSRLNDKQKKEVLKREGYYNNEAIFGSNKQFKRYAIDFVSTDKQKLKEAEAIYEIIFNKANRRFVFYPNKLSANRMYKQILNEVIKGKLNEDIAKKLALEEVPKPILDWIKKSEKHSKKKVYKNTKKVAKELTKAELDKKLAKIKKDFSRALTKEEIIQKLEKYENENIDPKYKMMFAKTFSRNPIIARYIKEKSGYRCEICGRLGFKKENGERYAEVHHIDELAKGGADLPSNLICVCPICHKKFHHGSEEVRKTLKLKR